VSVEEISWPEVPLRMMNQVRDRPPAWSQLILWTGDLKSAVVMCI